MAWIEPESRVFVVEWTDEDIENMLGSPHGEDPDSAEKHLVWGCPLVLAVVTGVSGMFFLAAVAGANFILSLLH